MSFTWLLTWPLLRDGKLAKDSPWAHSEGTRGVSPLWFPYLFCPVQVCPQMWGTKPVSAQMNLCIGNWRQDVILHVFPLPCRPSTPALLPDRLWVWDWGKQLVLVPPAFFLCPLSFSSLSLSLFLFFSVLLSPSLRTQEPCLAPREAIWALINHLSFPYQCLLIKSNKGLSFLLWVLFCQFLIRPLLG